MKAKSAMVMFGGKCFYCRRECVVGDNTQNHHATIDHDIPKCRGGATPNNEVLSCLQCNTAKGDMTGIEFIAFRESKRFPESYVEYLQDRLIKRLGI